MATSAGQGSPKRLFFSTPDQSQEERLNRFQAIISGSNTLTPEVLGMLEDRTGRFNLGSLLHGPLHGKSGGKEEVTVCLMDFLKHLREGKQHLFWMRCQREAAAKDPALRGNELGINVVFPRIISSDAEMPFIQHVALINDKDDARRIASRNIKKAPNFTPIFFQSLIATTDNAHWRAQRNHLNEVFLPKHSLAKIFPISLQRAKHCAARLGDLAAKPGPYGVQMHEFFLHEAQAQLQLALFGMDEEFMEKTNKNIRDVFSGTQEDPNYGKDMCLTMMRKVDENPAFATATEDEVRSGTKPVFGPLSKSVANAASQLNMNLFDQFGNMMLILFAGHDTTAHTMTWFTYEMAKNPGIQARLQKEVDDMFEVLGDRDMTYEDCSLLPFMTKCVVETLRLWTAVPNGTFRELEQDEVVKGPGGKPVTLPKGAYVQIVNLMRQRNPAYWGPDADKFNPDRDYEPSEVWNGCPFHASPLQSDRFSPFTFTPRECLGKNFAQMEMRTILSNVFRNFSFELSEPYTNFEGPIENVGGTMGPIDLTPEGRRETATRNAKGQGPQMAMYLKATPRRPRPAASKL